MDMGEYAHALASGTRWVATNLADTSMRIDRPHFVLYSEASADVDRRLRWKFVLQSPDEKENFSAADAEAETRTSRLELLAVVRGLEALDQPSRVTLLTRSRYVRRGIRRELNHWRERRWRWERFGKLVPIRDHDLWQRVDRALQFHQIECFPRTSSGREGSACTPGAHRLPDRTCRRTGRSQRAGASLAAALGRVGQSVISSLTSIWRPPFTRAA